MKSIPNLSPDRIAQFWMQVKPIESGCWVWTGASGRGGYGVFKVKNIQVYTHRVAWKLFYGALPDGLYILHHCDNPPCVNPDHLYAGTTQQNARDRVTRGRQPVFLGDANPATKLTPDKVREMRSLYAEGNHSYRRIANMFGVSIRAVRAAISRETWKHIA